MKGGDHVFAFGDKDGVAAVGSEDLGAGSDAPDDGGANEDGFERLAFEVQLGDVTVQLAAVSVALDIQIHEA